MKSKKYILLSAFAMGMAISSIHAQVLTTTGSNRAVAYGSMANVVDPGLTLSGGLNINKATATISAGFNTSDQLGFGTLPGGITASYNSASGVLTFTGSATPAQYQAALRTVTITTSTSSTANRTVTFTVGDLLASNNSHFYELVATNVNWVTAKADAATKTYNGLQGYLATITSSTENDFIRQKLLADAWIGASDEVGQINAATGTTTFANQAASESHWYWVTGPEKGTNFSNGNFVASPASAPVVVPGQYMNWASSEPNNSGGGVEHYAIIYYSNIVPGTWNDLPNNGTLLRNYVVEYGGMPGDPTVQVSSSRIVTMQSNSIVGSYNSGSYNPNATPKVVDNTLQLFSTSGNVTDARVNISGGFQNGDQLSFTGTLPGGVTTSYNTTTGVLTFTGTATTSQYQALLRTVRFNTTVGPNINRTITFSLGSNVAYSNGHFYQFVTGSINWGTAKTNADGMSYLGLTGYLATVGSGGENLFIQQKLQSDGWLGGSDDFSVINAATGTTTYANQTAAEGNWYWISGPEKGTLFSVGNAAPVTQPGQYANWSTGEPNNAGSEHSLQIYNSGNSGQWNDLDAGNNQNGYVVEYGGLASDQPVTLSSSSLIMVGSPLPVSGLSLSAVRQEQAVSVKWSTLNEMRVASHRVERSADGAKFTTAGTVVSKGNGDFRYEVLDTAPLSGTSFYRIVSIDDNGDQKVSSLVSVNDGGHTASIGVYPNPASDAINIRSTGTPGMSYSVLSIDGREVLKGTLPPTGGRIMLSSIASGSYQLIVSQDGVQTVKPFTRR